MADYKINLNALNHLGDVVDKAMRKTGQAVLTDLVQSQTMPFDTGEMQNNRTFVDDTNASKGEVTIRTISPQARRLYFHPEYNFQKGKNPNAGGRWFDPYIPGGSKEDFATDAFAKIVRRDLSS